MPRAMYSVARKEFAAKGSENAKGGGFVLAHRLQVPFVFGFTSGCCGGHFLTGAKPVDFMYV